MKALRFTGGQLAVADIPPPADPDEALVRVLKSGICSTDLEILRGYAGFEGTIGHEFVGMVEKAPGAEHLVGKRVVGEINAGCGICELCMSGDPRHCLKRTVLGIVGRDGAHAEYLQLPSRNLIEVPDSVSDEQAVFAEPLAAACGIAEHVSVNRESRVTVIGDGKLGLLCAFTLALRSDRVTLIGKHPEKLDLAARRGITTVWAPSACLTPDADIVVEASGSESGFALALEAVKPLGSIVLKSTFHGSTPLNASRIVVDEIKVIGSRCGRLEPAVKLLADGAVSVNDLVDEVFPLERGVAAVARASESGVLKVLLAAN